MKKIASVIVLCALYASSALYSSSAIGQDMCIINRTSDGKIARSKWAVALFKRQHPCPSTGLTRGRCPGYVADHARALCKCGADKPSNLRWQTIKAAKAKDRWECKPGWQDKLAACEAVAASCFS